MKRGRRALGGAGDPATRGPKNQKPTVERQEPSPPKAPVASRRVLSLALALIAANLMVYAAVYQNGFVNYDDPEYITENPEVAAGLSRAGLVWAFTTGHAANWHPLTWLSHMVDIQLFGLNAGPQHLVNLLLHIANTLLLFGLLHRMTGMAGRSAWVAGMFAVHPLHVESVAWLSERKDVLSTFFGILAICGYVFYARSRKIRGYLWTLLFFSLSLMAKPMLVTLPFVLLLLDYWPLGRFTFGGKEAGALSARRLVAEKVPLLLLAVASSVITFLVQKQGGAISAPALSWRLENAALSYVAYVTKMLWPAGLAVFYPLAKLLPAWRVGVSAIILIVISACCLRVAPRRGYLMAGWLWYLGTLVPVIGIIQVGSQSMADRYTYIPLVGLFIIAAWGMPDLVEDWPHAKRVLPVAAGVVLLSYSFAARAQVATWTGSTALWNHALRVTSGNYRAHTDLGNALSDEGRTDDAIAHYREALRIDPDFGEAHNNLANALSRQGRAGEATFEYTEALRTSHEYPPVEAAAHNGLGSILDDQGRTAEAIAQFQEAVRIQPDYASAHNNLGVILAGHGQLDQAAGQFEEALRINPDASDSHYNLGMVLKSQGRIAEAAQHLRSALALNPQSSAARKALAELGPGVQ